MEEYTVSAWIKDGFFHVIIRDKREACRSSRRQPFDGKEPWYKSKELTASLKDFVGEFSKTANLKSDDAEITALIEAA